MYFLVSTVYFLYTWRLNRPLRQVARTARAIVADTTDDCPRSDSALLRRFHHTTVTHQQAETAAKMQLAVAHFQVAF